jgi:DNA-binding MarR family transcriptional regulator
VARLSSDDFARLLAFRTSLRRFEHWSAGQARAAGLTPMQHQLLLAIKGHADPRGPTIGEIADYLLLRPHSAVELVDRGEAAGLVVRKRSDRDARVVRVRLTPYASRRLSALTSLHVAELRRFVPILRDLTNAVEDTPD